MEKQGNQTDTKKAKKRFWRDYESIEKFNFIIAVFAVFSSVAAIGLYFVTRETLQVSQRAFVYSKEVFIVGDGGKPGQSPADKPALIVITWDNSGETPARHVVPNVNFCARPGELPKDFSYPSEPRNVRFFIAPKAQAQTTISLPTDVLNGVETFKQRLWVYGDITYQDVFGHWHKTEFASVYGGFVLKSDGGEIEKHIFNKTEQHNCADDDCPRTWGNGGDCSSPN